MASENFRAGSRLGSRADARGQRGRDVRVRVDRQTCDVPDEPFRVHVVTAPCALFGPFRQAGRKGGCSGPRPTSVSSTDTDASRSPRGSRSVLRGVDARGLEPLTSWLPVSRCALRPKIILLPSDMLTTVQRSDL